MKENWLEHYRVDKPPSDVMCAYKLIKVEFRYWGMQVSKERSHKVFFLNHCILVPIALFALTWRGLGLRYRSLIVL